MLKSYLTFALRRLKRQPGYTFINVAGLAVAMACCLLVGLYMKDELSFDGFHERADRLFALSYNSRAFGPGLSTPYPLASTVSATLPEVEHAVRTWGGSRTTVTREEAQIQAHGTVLLTEPSFFEMFSFPTLAGDAVSALTAPDGVVITEATARRFFGEEDPIGKTLHLRRFDSGNGFAVRAVVQDTPANSTIQFEIAAPLSLLGEQYMQENAWNSSMYWTYVLTKQPVAAAELEVSLAHAIAQHFKSSQAGSDPPEFNVHPLSSVYLSDLYRAGGFKGQHKYLYIFGSVSVFILLIAAVNYVNLVTAQGIQRAREVGVRKAMGAARTQLVRQFLGESMLLSLTALIMAFLLVALALPAFNRLFEKTLTFGAGDFGFALSLLCALVLLLAVAAGAYPAFVLSRFRPTEVLRGAGMKTEAARGRTMRNGLVVLQFTISVVLITGTTIIYKQLDFIQNKDLGFDGEQVVVVNLPSSVSGAVRETLKQRSLSDFGVLRASVANGLPSRFMMTLGQDVAEVSSQARTEKEGVQLKPAVVDVDFVETLGISVLAGRTFSEKFPADETRAYVLNAAAAREFGWSPAEAIGKPFKLPARESVPDGEVIGVVADFHITSLHSAIDPIVLQLREDDSWSTSYALMAKLAPARIRDAIGHIERQFARVAPGESFEYEFLDDRFDAMYQTEQRLSQIFTTFAVLAIFVTCLGLFGLAAFTAQRRTKEIGVRKVLGASVSSIVGLLTKDVLKLVCVAFIVAAPLAYFVMSRWLEDFVYRIDIGPSIFILAGLLALTIVVATVSYQSIKAALADPVKSLRSE